MLPLVPCAPSFPLREIRIGLGWEYGLHSSTCSGSTCLNWILCLKWSKPGRLHRLLIVCNHWHDLVAHLTLIHPCVELFFRSRQCLLLLGNLSWSMCSNWMFSLMSNFLIVAARTQFRAMAHCTFDLNCTYSRVLSFHSVVLKFLRGFFFPRTASSC